MYKLENLSRISNNLKDAAVVGTPIPTTAVFISKVCAGNPIYPPAQREMNKRGVPFDSSKRAVQLKAEDYGKYDYLIGMDKMNIRNIIRIIGSDTEGKVYRLMDFTERKGDVADPWYSNRFDTAFNDIYEGCRCLLEKIKTQV